MARKEDALAYHRKGRPGKIEVVPTKRLATQRELSLAYSPGVAEPCREIAKDPSKADLYTARRNLVAVITDGSAVLGLGNIGPLAAKPVMEGKGVLFKKYADIDVFDIEVDASDPERFIEVVASLEPTFGGINLEDIAAPACFHIERTLEARMGIPVFHDDQHGTAIISTAALRNACELQGKELSELKVTCIGAGAAAMGCMKMWCSLGVKDANITLYDLDGVIKEDRPDLDDDRRRFARPATDTRSSLAEVVAGADVLIGLSAGGIVTEDMVKSMADKPIVFALANPDPEIDYELARKARPDAIVGTGRSDFPNQVNNVLGFPYIFRGALDVGATHINEEMKLAAANALAELAKRGVTDDVMAAYGGHTIKFGPEYIIPKAMDGRSLAWVAPAVAEAAQRSGVATRELDIEQYRAELQQRLDPTRRVLWQVSSYARQEPQRIIFPEGEEDSIIRAADIVENEGTAVPVLMGRPEIIAQRAESLGVNLRGVELFDTTKLPMVDEYAEAYWKLRRRKGLTRDRAQRILARGRIEYALMMLRQGHIDGVLSGLTQPYPETIRPALKIIGKEPGVRRACGCYMMIAKDGAKFFADTTINIEPDAETLAETAVLTANVARIFGIEPRVAMLSFSNFGDAPHPSSQRVARAVEIVRERAPGLMVEGEMQADVALLESARKPYPFARLEGSANVLVFPNLDAGNVAYKLLQATGSEVVGPLVLGMRKPVNVLQQGSSVASIVHMATLTSAWARRLKLEQNREFD